MGTRNRQLPGLLALSLLVVASGCSGPKKAEDSKRGASSKNAGVPESRAGDAGSAKGTEPADELIAAWVLAQNRGDFDAYQGLYASRFTGVRRSGPRTRTFDRAGWLNDRQRMFKQPMTVAVSEVKLRGSSRSSVWATFVQLWSSKTYRDVGPKQLVLVNESGKLRIAREELLASKKAVAQSLDELSREQLSFVASIENGPGPFLVLTDSADDSWAASPPTLVTKKDVVNEYGVAIVRRAVNEKALPDEWRALKKKTWTVYGGPKPCTDKIRSFAMIAQVVPHFGTVQGWRGETGEGGEPHVRASRAEVAEEVWEYGTQWLVAELGACDGHWARSADLAKPVEGDVSEVSDTLRDQAMARVRLEPIYKATQRDYERDGGKGPWESQDPSSIVVKSIEMPKGRRLLFVSISAGEGCGHFSAAFSAFWEVDGQSNPTTATQIFEAEVQPVAAFDIDGDGGLEFVAGPVGFSSLYELYRWNGTAFEFERLYAIDYRDCPC